MNVTVFGASGKTGMQIVHQALAAGDTIHAFVRTPGKILLSNEKLKIFQGDVLRPESIDVAVVGADAVLVALGPSGDMSGMPMTTGTTNIIASMKKHGVKRLVVESSFPMSGAAESMAFLRQVASAEQIASMKPMIDDKIGQEKAVRESGLEWIIVRPMSLTDGVKTGIYRSGETLPVKPGDSISRADVADFMRKASSGNEWVGKIVTISY